MEKEIEIPEGYEARIEGNKVILEPKESEDERIRKLLVWQVHRNIEDETNDLAQSVYDGIKGHDPDLEESIEDWKRCLAYLEKQKEPADGDFARGYDCGYECCLHSHGAEWFEKQKEQEPAEKQDYSELTDLERAIHRGFLVAGVENVPVTIIKETAKECLAQMEPAEWSEEDETALDDLIWCIEQARKCAKNENDMGNIWFAENWVKNRLKSFRPQPTWKPSEEQMKIFNEAVEHYSRYWDSEEIKILCSLYDDLKKL